MRVFLTGASGYLGGMLTAHLAALPEVEAITGVAISAEQASRPVSATCLSTGYLARKYGFTDMDGTQPIWYAGEGVFQDGNFVVRPSR